MGEEMANSNICIRPMCRKGRLNEPNVMVEWDEIGYIYILCACAVHRDLFSIDDIIE